MPYHMPVFKCSQLDSLPTLGSFTQSLYLELQTTKLNTNPRAEATIVTTQKWHNKSVPGGWHSPHPKPARLERVKLGNGNASKTGTQLLIVGSQKHNIDISI